MLREQVESARRITGDQKVVLDRIKHVHGFFKSFEVACGAVEDVRALDICELSNA